MEWRDSLVRHEEQEDLCWLADKIVTFCSQLGYTYEFIDNKFYGLSFEVNEMISMEGVKDYIASITHSAQRLSGRAQAYDSLDITENFISPTRSGNMIYSVVRFHVGMKRKVLLVVPTTSLVEQMFKDFQDYGVMQKPCPESTGRERVNTNEVTITTWQSVYQLDHRF